MSERQQILNDTRTMLDWLEAHPEIDLPYNLQSGLMITAPTTKNEMASLARLFGECEKEFVESGFYLRKRFGQASLYGYTSRDEVCERVVVGVEEVPESVTPAHTREIVEWRCAEPLLSGNGGSDDNLPA